MKWVLGLSFVIGFSAECHELKGQGGIRLVIINDNDHTIVQNNRFIQHYQMFDNTKVGEPTSTALMVPKLIGAALCGIYGYFWYRLYRYNNSIQSPERWSYWLNANYHGNENEQDERALALQLYQAIIARYGQKNDFLSPLVSFINDLDQEKTEIKDFLVLARRLSALRISWLFAHHIDTQNKAEAMLVQLEYLRKILITWLGEYSIESEKKA